MGGHENGEREGSGRQQHADSERRRSCVGSLRTDGAEATSGALVLALALALA